MNEDDEDVEIDLSLTGVDKAMVEQAILLLKNTSAYKTFPEDYDVNIVRGVMAIERHLSGDFWQ